jgi:type IV secretory pathway VirJ component
MPMKVIPICIVLAACLLCSCSPQETQPSETQPNVQLTGMEAKTRANQSGQLDITGLPLIEVNSSSVRFGYMAFLITGDEGWESADRALSRSLAASGVPVVALDWSRYFSNYRTPEEASESLEKILTHYRSTWNQDKIIAIGRSAGANALPFMLNRLPDSLLSHVEVVALLDPDSKTAPGSPAGDWLRSGNKGSFSLVRAEIEKLRAGIIYCYHGMPLARAACGSLDPKRVLVRALKSGSSPNVSYDAAAQEIVKKLR